MAVIVDWFIENHVIFMQFQEHVTIDDMVEASYEGHAHIALGDAPIHILVDARKVKTFPLNTRLMNERLPAHPAPERVGWVLVVTPDNALMRLVTLLFTQFKLMKHKFRVFTDIDSAIQFLYEKDDRLSDAAKP
ncbi:MAG: hypothetical protein IAE89_15735 [Anaerolineae bacterium]|nr:hypothetical protein [Anaerolineae bacterium]